ncbi:hypothetical protein [Vulcanisaeta souniana]|uniref:hypothetical protein n=1 Tax=Vulcanisaeta souniana TaxID=164452 RepID=UPI001FB32889|nr:hypothetical protein [Vulcanisaeta souniana]
MWYLILTLGAITIATAGDGETNEQALSSISKLVGSLIMIRYVILWMMEQLII